MVQGVPSCLQEAAVGLAVALCTHALRLEDVTGLAYGQLAARRSAALRTHMQAVCLGLMHCRSQLATIPALHVTWVLHAHWPEEVGEEGVVLWRLPQAARPAALPLCVSTASVRPAFLLHWEVRMHM